MPSLVRAGGAVVAAAVLVLTGCSSSSGGSTTAATSSPPGFALASDPVKAAKDAGVVMAGQEHLQEHYHTHLDVNVNGTTITVPAEIGIGKTSIAELHTHDDSGILHIEAEKDTHFTLKQLFTEWGVKFDGNCIATSCTDANNELRVYDNGKQVSDPANLQLQSGHEIYVWYGPKSAPPQVPASYNWPPGLAP